MPDSITHNYNLRDRNKIKKQELSIKEEIKQHMYNLRTSNKKDYTIFFTEEKDEINVN